MKALSRIISLLNATQETVSDVIIVHTGEYLRAAVNVAGDEDYISGPKIFEKAGNESEELEVHQNSSFLTAKDSVLPERPACLMQQQVIDIQKARKLLSFSSPHYFARFSLHLFPFGESHPGGRREIAVCLHECIKHYLRLSSRSFAQDATFPPIAFDALSRKRPMNQTSLT